MLVYKVRDETTKECNTFCLHKNAHVFADIPAVL